MHMGLSLFPFSLVVQFFNDFSCCLFCYIVFDAQQQMSEIVERESVATGITVEVEELQKRNKDSFEIPEWFLYSSRAFLTLEGVSLQANPKYSLIQACFPYVAKRLVGDDDPRARKALRDLLYGATDSVDVNRLAE